MAIILLSSCGGGPTRGNPLDRSWNDEDGTELEQFVEGWKVVQPPPVVEAVIGVTDESTIIGRALPDGRRWHFEHPLESRPIITGGVVVGLGEGELFALAVRTGELLWTRRAYGRLRGASDDGATTIVSMSSLSQRRSLVLAVKRDGHVARQFYDRAVIGAPTVLDSFAFLPYGDGLVVIFDLLAGTEAARVVSTSAVSRSFMVGTDIYFGERGALRFDREIVSARRGGGTYLELPTRDIAGDPQWMLPGDTALPLSAVRHDSIRFYARPKPTPTSARIDRYALSYFRIAVGLSSPDGATRWTHVAKAPFLGGAMADQMLVLCDAAGNVRWLDLETGSVIRRRSLDEAVLSCAVQSARSRPGNAPPNPAPLAEQLTESIAAQGEAVVPLQLELLEDLARLESASATNALVRLAHPRSRDTADRAVIRARAAELLESRRHGLEALVAAFNSTTIDLPVQPMVTAMVRRRPAGAAQALAWRLQDPRWTPERLAIIAEGLEALATTDHKRLLALFFGRIRCTQPSLENAVLAVARTLVRLGSGDLVKKVASEACDNAAMRERLGAMADGTPGVPSTRP